MQDISQQIRAHVYGPLWDQLNSPLRLQLEIPVWDQIRTNIRVPLRRQLFFETRDDTWFQLEQDHEGY